MSWNQAAAVFDESVLADVDIFDDDLEPAEAVRSYRMSIAVDTACDLKVVLDDGSSQVIAMDESLIANKLMPLCQFAAHQDYTVNLQLSADAKILYLVIQEELV